MESLAGFLAEVSVLVLSRLPGVVHERFHILKRVGSPRLRCTWGRPSGFLLMIVNRDPEALERSGSPLDGCPDWIEKGCYSSLGEQLDVSTTRGSRQSPFHEMLQYTPGPNDNFSSRKWVPVGLVGSW